MSHRKIYSQGSIPFSWEDSPGVTKTTFFANQDCLINYKEIDSLALLSPPVRKLTSFLTQEVKKVPPPPCPNLVQHHHRRSASAKGFRWRDLEDPFLAAYKECTKDVSNINTTTTTTTTRIIGSQLLKKSMAIFCCKNSCEVRDDNLVSISILNPTCRKNDCWKMNL